MKHIYKHFIMHYFYAAANGKQLLGACLKVRLL